MVLQRFSNSLFELYDVARQTAPNQFPKEVMRIVGKLISFDGAIFGAARLNGNQRTGVTIEQAYIHSSPEKPVRDYTDIFSLDPVAQLLMSGLPEPTAVDCTALNRVQNTEEMEKFTLEYGLQKMLLCGDFPSTPTKTRWIALYRNTENEFAQLDAEILRAIWHHVARTIEINLNEALGHLDPHSANPAVALINSRGVIEVANAALVDVMRIEWPLFDACHLPFPVVAELVNNGRYRGRKIEITASQKFGYLACTAKSRTALDILAPSELNVADRFAKGMTHSEIAAHFCVSPHTVRNQIAQVYQKLGIHSKVELAHLMASRNA